MNSRRRAICSAFGASLASVACGKNLSVRTMDVAFDNFLGRDAFDPDYPDRLRYASMAVSLPEMKRALVVLGKVEGDELLWFTADRGVLVTRFGRLVRSAGFQNNLARTEFVTQDFLDPAVVLKDGEIYQRNVDFLPGNYFGAPVRAILRLKGEETVLVGKRRMQLRLLEESVEIPGLNLTYANRFWVDTKRFVWRSVQYLSPLDAPMTIEVMKPYGGSKG